ncbi:hypothetical protein CROQUDRAFT_130041 [Cronartium quercuum f. sp. fusiforme G11]|uniref:Uncharacterized protein n=1 Tax=Cronartium quercuum f. sp. fusiforme G11 TaxID=708437 RepID=A0A9P6TGS8_9BASI|nr:hypothetical protein CROQUDRAFT_130041 [Cronartium quercuum f. sp. fusiforme G11]
MASVGIRKLEGDRGFKFGELSQRVPLDPKNDKSPKVLVSEVNGKLDANSSKCRCDAYARKSNAFLAYLATPGQARLLNTLPLQLQVKRIQLHANSGGMTPARPQPSPEAIEELLRLRVDLTRKQICEASKLVHITYSNLPLFESSFPRSIVFPLSHNKGKYKEFMCFPG